MGLPGRKIWAGGFLSLLVLAGLGRADESEEGLRQLYDQLQRQQEQIQRQQRQIEELMRRVGSLAPPGEGKGDPAPKSCAEPPAPASSGDGKSHAADERSDSPLTTESVKELIGKYLKDRPGAGMPPGVQTGFANDKGFYIRSAPNPSYVKPDAKLCIPFEMRFHGRGQFDYYFYKVTDNLNHLTGQRYAPEVGDFSQFEVKRLRLLWEGTAFDSDLRYQFQIDGNTRGLGAFQSNRTLQNIGTPPAASYGAPGIGTANIGGGAAVDHAVRLFTAWVAYDFHLASAPSGPGSTARYSPTLTFIAGKQQPFFGLTEVLGSANAQLVDFAMADWFFDADDNNMMTSVAVQYRGVEDRLFMTALVTNGNESQFPNTQMDRLPGFNAGFWYDFGGTWDEKGQRWALFGPSLSDLQYSCQPVVRVGAAANLVPMDRRSIYGDVEQSRVLVVPGGPGGTRLLDILNGDAGSPPGAHAVDKFDSYTYDVFASGHYRGFSLTNEWWFRSLNGFQTSPLGGDLIVYQDASGANALFPSGRGLFDYGTLVQAGYFLVPKKFEVVARYSWIRGQSGDVNGDGRFRTVAVPGFTTPLRVVEGAFRNFHEASEIATGFNYFFHGQLVKWTSDFSVYQGGNPAVGGASASGFIPGVDGWLVRTQLQLGF